jgi:hypothetical protein
MAVPAFECILLGGLLIEDSALAVEFDHLPTRARYAAVKGYVNTGENVVQNRLMVGARCRLHVRRTYGEASNDLLRSAALAHFLFEVGQCLHEEKRRNDGKEEIVEPVGFVDAEALKCGLVENKVRSGRRVLW